MNIESLESAEEQTRMDTREREFETLQALERTLNLYLTGFGEFSSFIPAEDNRLQQIWFLLTIRSFKSLRTAHYLLETGYYSQALMLIRSAAEDWLYCEDSKEQEETVRFLLDRKGGPSTFRTMSDRLEPHLKQGWQGDDGKSGSYALLSRFTHPNYAGIATLFATQDSGIASVGFDECLFLVTSNYLLLRLIRTVEFLARLVNPQSEWLRECQETINTVDELRSRNAAREEMLLNEDR